MAKRKSTDEINYKAYSDDDLNGPGAKKAASSQQTRFSTAHHDLSELNDMHYERNNLGLSPSSSSSISLNKQHNIALSAGVIESVSFKNFKCHSLLQFDFNPNINFILGRNGSGKSAVMDGVILCLGGRATATGRKAAAPTFIKKNAIKAELSVTLRNIGSESYKADVYGQKIRIERRLTKDGGSSYKLFSEKNELISIKKEEINNILEQFNIQVDNPVCFLNQETSKNFLNTSNNKTKYSLFLKASQIEAMNIFQEKSEKELDDSRSLLNDKVTSLAKLRDELYEMEEKYKKCESIEKLLLKQHLLMQEYTWALTINCENIHEHERKHLESESNIEREIQAKKEEHELALEKVSAETESVEETKLELENREKHALSQSKAASDTFKNISTQNKTAMNDTKKLNTLIARKQKEIEVLKEKLNEERIEEDFEEERKQKEDQIKSIQNELNAKIEADRREQQEAEKLSKLHNEDKKQLEDKGFEIKNCVKRINSLNEAVENLRRASTDQIYRYGNQMANLVKDIETNFQQRRFKEKPLGPIGMYVDVKEKNYSLAIESCLGDLVKNFICANYEDEKVLQHLMSVHFRGTKKPRIIVTAFTNTLYDLNRYQREFPDHPTVYDMLNIRSTVVANVLFDQKRIESILLLPDYDTAKNTIQFKSTAYFNQAFTPNGDQFLGKPSYRIYSSQLKQPKYLEKSTQNAIQDSRNEIETLSQHIPLAQEAIERIKAEININKQRKEQHDKQINELRKEINVLRERLEEAKNIYIPEPVSQAVYEDEINELENEINELKEQIQQVTVNSGNVSKTDYDKAASDVNKWESEIQNIQAEITANNETYEGHKNNRLLIEDNFRYFTKRWEKYKSKVEAIRLRVVECKDDAETHAALALKACGIRLNTKKTTEMVENELKNIANLIKINEKYKGNKLEIIDAYTDMKEKYKKIKLEIIKLKTFHKRLSKALESRKLQINNLKCSKSLRCTKVFTEFLTHRNYQGNLKFDHKLLTLDVIVQPNQSRDAHNHRDLKSLSGGERSFSTVAFLISLWSIVESPVLFLDEFDVFMDQINRQHALELIIDAAKKNTYGQHVFLTPQDIEFIENDENIKIYKMPDPKRNGI